MNKASTKRKPTETNITKQNISNLINEQNLPLGKVGRNKNVPGWKISQRIITRGDVY